MTIVYPLKVISTEDVAVALADEGVPVRAIARAVQVESEDVYGFLNSAMDDGKLIELPQPDWPAGTRRWSRRPSPSSVLNLDDDMLNLACAAVFQMTRLQAAVFVAIVRRPEITKEQVHIAIESTRSPNADPTDPKMIDVVICHIRKKLKPFKLELKTIWGRGYSLAPRERTIVLSMITEHLQPQQQAA